TFLYITNTSTTKPSTFPYTTLFRSRKSQQWPIQKSLHCTIPHAAANHFLGIAIMFKDLIDDLDNYSPDPDKFLDVPFVPTDDGRSEEHTSELQSRENLVCRLLLEKK